LVGDGEVFLLEPCDGSGFAADYDVYFDEARVDADERLVGWGLRGGGDPKQRGDCDSVIQVGAASHISS
jgi:hypothetical protein